MTSACRGGFVRTLTIALLLILLAPLGARAQIDERVVSRDDPFLQMWARSFYPGRSGDIMLVPREGDILTSGTDPFEHGSPWGYDTQVPMILYGPDRIRPGRYAETASHQDLGATLVSILGLINRPEATGRVLEAALLPSSSPPRIVAVLVLDAFRYDFLERYADRLPQLVSMREGGASFEGRVTVLPTSTAVSHTTLSTATDPSIHGITGNRVYDPVSGRRVDPFDDGTPRNLMALTVADLWGAATAGRAVIVSLGGRDYPATALAGHGRCLVGGRAMVLAYLSSRTGTWSSNPECFRLPEYMAGLGSTDAVARIYQLLEGGASPQDPTAALLATELARFEGEGVQALLRGEPFGVDSITDLLLVNLKATDHVGHTFGPFSGAEEAAVAELDRQIGEILAILEEKAGPGGYVVAITADHGMADEPVVPDRRHIHAELIGEIDRHFDPDGPGVVLALGGSDSQIYLDHERLAELELTTADVAAYLETLPFIHAAYTADEVEAAGAAEQGPKQPASNRH
jgi:hypothetical protein